MQRCNLDSQPKMRDSKQISGAVLAFTPLSVVGHTVRHSCERQESVAPMKKNNKDLTDEMHAPLLHASKFEHVYTHHL